MAATACDFPFRSVVSIGPQCLTSTMLQRAGLKAFSGPFDWIFSSLDMVCDCIETNFADLLNVDFLKPVPPDRRPDPGLNFAHHMLYRERYGLDSIFNHYDPRTPERYAYLRRCVQRLRAVLASTEPQLLLAIGDEGALDERAMRRLFALLDQRTTAVTAWIVAVGAPADAQSWTLAERAGRHAIFAFRAYSPIEGIAFRDPRDNDFLTAQLRALVQLEPATAGVGQA